jgi:non-specific serine/threonine protein kinase
MLETVREYALEELTQADEIEMIQRRHLAFYLSLAQQAAQALDGPQQAMWLARLDDDHENFRAALSFAIFHAKDESVRLAAALGRFWEIRGYLLEGRRWLTAALAAAPTADLADRAVALRAAGALARTSGDYEGARSLTRASIDLQERAAPARTAAEDEVATAELARTWFELAQVAHYVGDFRENASACDRSLALYERVADRRGVAAATGMLGHAAWHLHDLTRALELITHSIAVWEELGDSLSVSWAYWDLGNIARDAGNLEGSRGNFEVALLGGRRAGDPELLAVAIEGLAFLEFLDGRAHVATEWLGAAEEVRRSHAMVRAAPYDRDVYGPILAAIRDALPTDEFQDAWAVGAARGLQDTIDLVLPSGKGRADGGAIQHQTHTPADAPLPHPSKPMLAGLTPRESEVLRLLAQGHTNQEIADSLVISLNTVYRHVSSILAKTGSANRTEAALLAIRSGADLPEAPR